MPANQGSYKYMALNQRWYAGSSASSACSTPPANSYPYAFDNADNLTTIEHAVHTGTNAHRVHRRFARVAHLYVVALSTDEAG